MDWYWWILLIILLVVSIPLKIKFMKKFSNKNKNR